MSQVASASLESSLLKYSVKEYFFRAALCHLCVDVLNAQHAIERYQEQYPAFEDSRECKLIKVWDIKYQSLDIYENCIFKGDTILYFNMLDVLIYISDINRTPRGTTPRRFYRSSEGIWFNITIGSVVHNSIITY